MLTRKERVKVSTRAKLHFLRRSSSSLSVTWVFILFIFGKDCRNTGLFKVNFEGKCSHREGRLGKGERRVDVEEEVEEYSNSGRPLLP